MNQHQLPRKLPPVTLAILQGTLIRTHNLQRNLEGQEEAWGSEGSYIHGEVLSLRLESAQVTTCYRKGSFNTIGNAKTKTQECPQIIRIQPPLVAMYQPLWMNSRVLSAGMVAYTSLSRLASDRKQL